MKAIRLTLIFCVFVSMKLYAQDIEINVFANDSLHTVSPYLFGRNGGFSDEPQKPTSSTDIQLFKDAGLRFVRQNSGNNATKYNWRKKLSSHPDWYNNVYAHD